ncbi:Uncharacterised protein [Bordetella pertussis]|nr:Uncharacterised protein [Bordetella pertussis]
MASGRCWTWCAGWCPPPTPSVVRTPRRRRSDFSPCLLSEVHHVRPSRSRSHRRGAAHTHRHPSARSRARWRTTARRNWAPMRWPPRCGRRACSPTRRRRR